MSTLNGLRWSLRMLLLVGWKFVALRLLKLHMLRRIALVCIVCQRDEGIVVHFDCTAAIAGIERHSPGSLVLFGIVGHGENL